MQQCASLAALCLALAVASATAATTKSPVEAIVKLLEDLNNKIEADAEVEQKAYDKFACWCEKTTDRKADAINRAQQELRLLGQKILKFKGQVATLESEISELAAEMEANQALQADATNLRQKENAEYVARTTETKEALAALEKAVKVLVAATTPALLQQQEGAARAALKNILEALPSTAVVKPEDVTLLSQLATGRGAYAPQSATIQGILKDLYDTFSGDLESTTGMEATRNAHFEKLIHEKTFEFNVLSDTKARKQAENSEAELLLAETVQNYDDTDAQRKADIAFFDETTSACLSKHSVWVGRTSLRNEELAGIKKCLEILTSDEARATFAAADKPGIALLQVQSVNSVAAPVVLAYDALKKQASSSHSFRLAALAVRVRDAKVGHFDEVVKAIDSMIATLKSEDLADIAKRDQCKEEYQKTASAIAHVTWLVEKNEAKIHKLEDLIALQNKERDATIADIQDVTEQIATLEANRAAENAAFLSAQADDKKAIALLNDALAAFTAFYHNHAVDVGALVQKKQKQEPEFAVSEDQAPDTVFTGHDTHKHESKGISLFLTNIVEDLHKEIESDTAAEAASQAEFEKQHAAAEALKKDLIVKKTNLEESIAKREEDKSNEHATKTGNEADLKDEQHYVAKIKPDCDWIIGAFKERAGRRTSELNGLTGAKEYLAGAQPSLLEKGRAFDDGTLSKLRFLGLKK